MWPAPARDERRKEALVDLDGSPEVDLEDPAPIVEAQFPPEPGLGDTNGVHDQVDASVGIERFGEHARDVARTDDISGDHQRLESHELLAEPSESGSVDVGEHEPVAGYSAQPADAGAERSRRAEDDHHSPSARIRCHRVQPPCRFHVSV